MQGQIGITFNVASLEDTEVEALVATLNDPASTEEQRRIATYILGLDQGIKDLFQLIEGLASLGSFVMESKRSAPTGPYPNSGKPE